MPTISPGRTANEIGVLPGRQHRSHPPNIERPVSDRGLAVLCRRVKELLQLPADHESHDGLMADLRSRPSSPALRPSRSTVTRSAIDLNLGEPVRNVHAPLTPARFRSANDVEEPIGFRFAVKLDVGSSMMRMRDRLGKGPGDLDQLLLADRQVADRPAAASVSSPTRASRVVASRVMAVFVEPEAEQAAPGRLPAQEQVGRRREILREVQFLMDEHDAVSCRAPVNAGESHRPAVEQDVARVGPIDAGEDFHQRRFAGPVLADDGQHLPGRAARRPTPSRACTPGNDLESRGLPEVGERGTWNSSSFSRDPEALRRGARSLPSAKPPGRG